MGRDTKGKPVYGGYEPKKQPIMLCYSKEDREKGYKILNIQEGNIERGHDIFGVTEGKEVECRQCSHPMEKGCHTCEEKRPNDH